MDILLYDKINSCKKNIDYVIALRNLKSDNLTVEKVRWCCKFDTVHTGNLLAEAFGLNKSIMQNCPTYESICNTSNAVSEILKVNIVYEAFKDDINVNIDLLSIMQNNEQVAIGYLQNKDILKQVCSNIATLRELVKKQSYCNTVKATINNHRSIILNTLTTNKISYTDVQLGSGSGTFTHSVGGNNLMLAYSCYDDNDTSYSIYGGEGTHRVHYVGSHSGTVSIDNIVCLRGTKLVGSGNTVGYVKYKLYNL